MVVLKFVGSWLGFEVLRFVDIITLYPHLL